MADWCATVAVFVRAGRPLTREPLTTARNVISKAKTPFNAKLASILALAGIVKLVMTWDKPSPGL